jgi:hypothetical protein
MKRLTLLCAALALAISLPASRAHSESGLLLLCDDTCSCEASCLRRCKDNDDTTITDCGAYGFCFGLPPC